MKRAEIINAWRSFVGVRNLWQGRNPSVGLDCAGVLFCANQLLGYAPDVDANEPYNTPEQTRILDRLLAEHWDEIAKDETQPGDLYLFHMPRRWQSHIALLSKAPDWLIHVYETVDAVVEHPLDIWLPYVVRAYRYRGLED